MRSSDYGSSSSLSYRPAVISAPNCNHGLPTHILTDHTEQNSGRRFFACAIRKWDDCDFIQWIDETSPESFCRNSCDRKLKAEKEKHEAELKCKEMIHEILQEKLNMKTQECELLKVMLQKANTEVECQKRNVWAMVQGVVLDVAAVSFVFRFVSHYEILGCLSGC